MKITGKFILKHPLLFMLMILAYIYAIVSYPLVFLKRKLLGLESYKSNIFLVLNKFYNVEFNEENYILDNSILSETKILKRGNELSLFASCQKEKKGVCFQILVARYNNDFGYPITMQKSLHKLSKLFKIEQFFNIHFENHKISKLTLRILFYSLDNQSRFNGVLNSTGILQIELTPNFEIVKVQKFINNNDITEMLKSSKFYDGMPFDEIALIIYLESLKDREDIHELLPEIRIPSVYDFASDDFKNRLLLVEMMEY